jgi:hypothetical protein
MFTVLADSIVLIDGLLGFTTSCSLVQGLVAPLLLASPL